jgi:phosphatidylglycerol:prolipoprotein diacylglycerol transferase
MNAVGFFMAIIAALILAKKQKLDYYMLLNSAVLIILGGTIGGRIFYLIFVEKTYALTEFPKVWEPGSSMQGGAMLAFLLVYFYLKYKKANILDYFDVIGISFILFNAIKRIGCFLNWCCYGIESSLPWAIKVGNDVSRHPTQIYTSIINLIIFVILFKMYKKSKKPSGYYFGITFIIYGIFRFFIEFIRINPRIFYLTLPQIGSLTAVILGAVVMKIVNKNSFVKVEK